MTCWTDSNSSAHTHFVLSLIRCSCFLLHLNRYASFSIHEPIKLENRVRVSFQTLIIIVLGPTPNCFPSQVAAVVPFSSLKPVEIEAETFFFFVLLIQIHVYNCLEGWPDITTIIEHACYNPLLNEHNCDGTKYKHCKPREWTTIPFYYLIYCDASICHGDDWTKLNTQLLSCFTHTHTYKSEYQKLYVNSFDYLFF